MAGIRAINCPFKDNHVAFPTPNGHIRPMMKTVPELMRDLAGRIRARRLGLGWPQVEAASRAGVAYRTWRRLETAGEASIEDLVKAAVALRCEDGLSALFPEPAATTLDELLARQAAARSPPARQRARPGSRPKARP